jgi:hypothetical protein
MILFFNRKTRKETKILKITKSTENVVKSSEVETKLYESRLRST